MLIFPDFHFSCLLLHLPLPILLPTAAYRVVISTLEFSSLNSLWKDPSQLYPELLLANLLGLSQYNHTEKKRKQKDRHKEKRREMERDTERQRQMKTETERQTERQTKTLSKVAVV